MFVDVSNSLKELASSIISLVPETDCPERNMMKSFNFYHPYPKESEFRYLSERSSTVLIKTTAMSKVNNFEMK